MRLYARRQKPSDIIIHHVLVNPGQERAITRCRENMVIEHRMSFRKCIAHAVHERRGEDDQASAGWTDNEQHHWAQAGILDWDNFLIPRGTHAPTPSSDFSFPFA